MTHAFFLIICKCSMLIMFFIQKYIGIKFDIIGFIHNILTAGLSHYLYAFPNTQVMTSYKIKKDDIIMHAGLFSLAYGFYDVFVAIIEKKIDFIIHGIIIIMAVLYLYVNSDMFKYFELMVIEMSSIFLSLRDTFPKSLACNILFFIFYFVYRVVILNCITFQQLQKNHTCIFQNTLLISICILNLLWFKKILYIAHYKLFVSIDDNK